MQRRLVFPFAAEVKNKADDGGGETGESTAQPETPIFHTEIQTKKQRQENTQDQTVKNGANKVDLSVAAAIGQSIHGVSAGTAKEHQHGDGDVLQGKNHDFRVVGKDTKNLMGEANDQCRKNEGDAAHDREGRTQNFGNTIKVAGTDILPYHGGTGSVNRIGEQAADIEKFVSDTSHSGNCNAVRVDPGTDEQYGELDGSQTECQRDAQIDQRLQHSAVNMEKMFHMHLKTQLVAVFPQENYTADEAESLADDSGQSGTGSTQVEFYNKQQIQHNVHAGSNCHKDKGMLGVTQTAEHCTHGIVTINEDQTGDANGGVAQSLLERFDGRVQNVQNLTAEHEADYTHSNCTGEKELECSADKPPQFIFSACADVLGDNNLGSSRETYRDESEEAGDVTADSNRRQTGLADCIADNDHVHHVVDNLQQVGQKQRGREFQKLSGNVASGEVLNQSTVFRCARQKSTFFRVKN